jgi:hypothetical protein
MPAAAHREFHVASHPSRGIRIAGNAFQHREVGQSEALAKELRKADSGHNGAARHAHLAGAAASLWAIVAS